MELDRVTLKYLLKIGLRGGAGAGAGKSYEAVAYPDKEKAKEYVEKMIRLVE